jgi:hypothetical protein
MVFDWTEKSCRAETWLMNNGLLRALSWPVLLQRRLPAAGAAAVGPLRWAKPPCAPDPLLDQRLRTQIDETLTAFLRFVTREAAP